MNTITHTFLLTGLASFVCLIASCGGKKDDTTPEPIETPVVAKKAPAPRAPTTNPLLAFATPDDDLKLPTEAQTAEGKYSSIGTANGTNLQSSHPDISDNSPSIAISPPAAPVTVPTPDKPGNIATEPEDELDPQ